MTTPDEIPTIAGLIIAGLLWLTLLISTRRRGL